MKANDQFYMQHALRVGARNLGRTWPKPSVGCVLVKNNQVIAAACSADLGGRPHAEEIALEQAGAAARGATAYVTLEPCAHQSANGPCAQQLIDAGIARVVIAQSDPDERTSGKGIAILHDAHIDTRLLNLTEAAQQHRGFFRRVRHGLPYVIMKLATSADAQMADKNGKSQWITGEAARLHGHALRSHVDAVLTGIGTVLADDPRYTLRLPGDDHVRLARVIADRQLRLPLESQMVRTADQHPVWVATTATAVEEKASHATALREAGVELIILEDSGFYPFNILQALAKAGITRLLIEAGPSLSTAFLSAACVDTLYWYRAPILLGNTGHAAVAELQAALADTVRARKVLHQAFGDDSLDIYELLTCLPAL